MRTLRFAALAVLLSAAPAFGASVTLTGVGQTFALDYNGIADIGGVATVLEGLSATVEFKVTQMGFDKSMNRTIVGLSLVVRNTTDSNIFQYAAVTGIGFDTDPNVARRAGSSASGFYDYLAFDQTLPTGAGFMVEVCVSGRANKCTGPASAATQIGQVTQTSVQLAFYGKVTSPITLDNFGVRYAGLLSKTYGILKESPGIGIGTPPIPEPASAAVFGLGALTVAAALRRRRTN